jgi:hypothetical protein
MCDFDQLGGRGVFRMDHILAVASVAERLHAEFWEVTMRKTEITERSEPQQDKHSKVGQPCHEGSAKVVGKSLDVNENDVRDHPQQDNPSKDGKP